MFGKRPRGTRHDLFALIGKLKRRGARSPKLKIDCGTDDFLIEQNREFHAYLGKIGVPHRYDEYPGAHNWDYWEAHLPEALAFHARALGLAK